MSKIEITSAEAIVRLEKLQAEYSGPNVEDAEAAKEAAIGAGISARAVTDDLRRELDKAIYFAKAKHAEDIAACSVYEAAKSHHAAVEELEAIAIKLLKTGE